MRPFNALCQRSTTESNAPVKVEWDCVRANFGRETAFEFIEGDST